MTRMKDDTKEIVRKETCYFCDVNFNHGTLKKVDKGGAKVFTCGDIEKCKHMHPEKKRIKGKIPLNRKGGAYANGLKNTSWG